MIINEKDFKIIEIEKDEDQEHIDYVRNEHERNIIWLGVLQIDKDMKIRFRITDYKCNDNGGVGVDILSKKPKNISIKNWEDLQYDMKTFIETEYNIEGKNWD